MMSLKSAFRQFAAVASLFVCVGCGSMSPKNASKIKWSPVVNTNRAFLEMRDLEDQFLFGMRVVESKNFFTTALTVQIKPTLVNLKLEQQGSGSQLVLSAVDTLKKFGGASLMSFNAAVNQGGALEIDFGTETYIDLSEFLINPRGGQATEEREDVISAPWTTTSGAKPRVIKITQDADTLVADVEHFVSYTRTDIDGKVESRSGSVTLRVYLARKSKESPLPVNLVGQALSHNIGFFGSDWSSRNPAQLSISRYNVGVSRSKTIYLKGFPSEMVDTGTKAITAWNIAFGFEAFRVEIAPDNVDIGDPRYNVVKWVNGLEKEIGWAGIAQTMVDPVSGSVVATEILINGDFVHSGLSSLASYTQDAATEFKALKGTIAGVPVVEAAGENPMLAFFTDVTQPNTQEYVKGYYFNLIMHEFGHSLGLRHNFAASTKLDTDGLSSSVMDYLPYAASSNKETIGSYDFAAIRYGYFNEIPVSPQVFCTDGDIEDRMDCNQGDLGNKPVDYVIATLLNGVGFLSQSSLPLPKYSERPMRTVIKTAGKMYRLTQDPVLKNQLKKALLQVRDATPSPDLASSVRAIVEANLANLKASYNEVKAKLPQDLVNALEN